MYSTLSTTRISRRTTVWGAAKGTSGSRDVMGHLNRGWLPVEPRVWKAIQEHIRDESFIADREALCRFIKHDPGTYATVCRLAGQLSEVESAALSPLARVREADPRVLRAIFERTPSQISKNSLRTLGKNQALSLQRMVAGVAVAEKVAQGDTALQDDASTLVLFKQLGRALITWNYPTLIARALALQRTNRGSFDAEIERTVGLSELEIIKRLADECRVPQHFRQLLGVGPVPVSVAAVEGQSGLGEIAEFADLFSQRLDPSNFPDAEARWSRACESHPQLLAHTSVIELEDELRERMRPFNSWIGEHHRVSVLNADPVAAPSETMRRRNPLVLRIPAEFRPPFEKMYALPLGRTVSVEALQLIVGEIIPRCGFRRGCLYLLDKSGITLEPKLRFGDLPIRAYHPIGIDEDHPVAQAVFSAISVQEIIAEYGKEFPCFSSGFADSRAEGVLYLEANPDSAEMVEFQPLLFRTIREALMDALSLRTNEHELTEGETR